LSKAVFPYIYNSFELVNYKGSIKKSSLKEPLPICCRFANEIFSRTLWM